MTASEKVAYLKGLAEGLGVSAEDKEGKLTLAMIDVLESLANDVEDLEANTADLADAIDDIGEDMAYLEDMCMGDLEDDYDDDYDDDDNDYDDFGDCDADCSGCPGCSGDDEQEYEVTCPQCGEVITVYESDLDFGSILCPQCGADLEFDLDEDNGEDN